MKAEIQSHREVFIKDGTKCIDKKRIGKRERATKRSMRI